MSKQTALQWLEAEINSKGPIENNPPKWLQDIYNQAKEMEKDIQESDIRFAYMAGFNRGLDKNSDHLENYIKYIKTVYSHDL